MLNSLEISVIKDFVISSKIYYDDKLKQNNTENEDDEVSQDDSIDSEETTNIKKSCEDEVLEIYNDFYKIINESSKNTDKEFSPWILRFEFDRSLMLSKNIKMEDIFNVIYKHFNHIDEFINCVYSDDNSQELFFRINYITKKNTKVSIIDNEDMISTLKTIRNKYLEFNFKRY